MSLVLDGANGSVTLSLTEAETLVRLACTAIDENDIDAALRSFGDPTEVEALAMRVGKQLFYGLEES